MKKLLAILLILLCSQTVYFSLQRLEVPMSLGIDFRLRYNEVKCILSGTDPLLIWNRTVTSPVYSPLPLPSHSPVATYEVRDGKIIFVDENRSLVHSYPPWSYTYLMPLAFLPRNLATGLFALLELAVMLILFAAVFRWELKEKRHVTKGWVYLLVATSIAYSLDSIVCCLQVLNYGILIAGTILGMIVCLNRGHDVLAGLCWAFMMVKPQLTLLFAIPLVMFGKWRTILTAALVCFIASLPPAILCGRSPLTMIFSIVEYSRGYGMDVSKGLPLLPVCVVERLFPYFSSWGILALNAALGVVGCCLTTWFVCRNKDWLFRLLPTIVFCSLWTVSRDHDRVCLIFVCVGAAICLLRFVNKLLEKGRQ